MGLSSFVAAASPRHSPAARQGQAHVSRRWRPRRRAKSQLTPFRIALVEPVRSQNGGVHLLTWRSPVRRERRLISQPLTPRTKSVMPQPYALLCPVANIKEGRRAVGLHGRRLTYRNLTTSIASRARMSAIGTKRTFQRRRSNSAFGGKLTLANRCFRPPLALRRWRRGVALKLLRSKTLKRVYSSRGAARPPLIKSPGRSQNGWDDVLRVANPLAAIFARSIT